MLANDSDVDGPFLKAVLVDPPTHGTLQLLEDGSLQYTPQQGFIGDDAFTYRGGRFDRSLDGHSQSKSPFRPGRW